MQIVDQIKSLALLEPAEIHRRLETLFSEAECERLSDDAMFSLVHDIRVVFFRVMDDSEKARLCSLLLERIESLGSLTPQFVEFSGVIFKYVPAAERERLFDGVFRCAEALCASPRGIVALTTFIKYTNKTYDERKKQVTERTLRKLWDDCTEELRDTLLYTEENLRAEFSPRKADVLLLIPEFLSGSSFLQPPLCCLRTAAELVERGFTVDILDNRIYQYSLETLTRLVGANYRYPVLLSTPLDQIQTYFIDHRFLIFAQTCGAVRRDCQFEKLIVAGAHGTVDARMLLADVDPDVIVRGEFDEKLADTILCCAENRLSEAPDGTLYRDGGEWKRSHGGITARSWETTPLDFSLLNLKDYFGYRYLKNTHVKQRNWAILQASRGCPYQCTFCYNLYGRKVRHKDVETLIHELRQLKKAGCQEIFYIDQTFTLDGDYVRRLCSAIEEQGIDIPWQCETRVDLVDEALLREMKRAGCKAIWLGIESFDESVLRKCKKGYRLEQLREAFRILHRVGMEYHAFIMVGMEGETAETIEHTVSIIEREKIKLSKSIIQCTPRPGTEYYTHLPETLRDAVKHFWQIDALRAYSRGTISSDLIGKMTQRLMLIANEG